MAFASCDWRITGMVGVFCTAGLAEESLDTNDKKLK